MLVVKNGPAAILPRTTTGFSMVVNPWKGGATCLTPREHLESLHYLRYPHRPVRRQQKRRQIRGDIRKRQHLRL